ncbi:alpha/beta fold hydrolase [Niallia endozanthoxylica]|uniref:Alpha/beta fold hydrolase n=1 Tax=Niallia endozanthoxylica TaxID=2036016 RepID=A0A5J5HND0_9BACI|nr:alpha/beta fold hydrolase [Niallia endozanthoxylica]KAA9022003.1 alpha/beta fold hydrolase [Niallia endozanthoxylica]
MPTAVYKQGTIFYEEKGSGEPLIFIHGVGLDHTMWKQQKDSLSDSFRVIVYDMLGHGGSEHPPGPYSLTHYVEQLSGLMEYLQIEKTHLVGFSMGGMVAQAFALTYKNKLKTLTIMNAVANRTDEQRKGILARVEEVRENGPLGTIEPAIQRWFNPEFIESESEVVNQVRHRLQTNNPASYLAAYTLFATADAELWPKLKNIETPAFIITAEHDLGSNPQMGRQMHERIKGSDIRIVPGMKHMLPVEGAEIVNNELRRFIGKQASQVG